MNEKEKRYIGLDVHKHYLIALGVNEALEVVLPARRVELAHLEAWMKKTLTRQDAVALEMTTNTWQLYDELSEYAGSVTVVHPPHVALITRAQVMTDKIAASILARLLAKGLLVGVWVPPQEVRELRGLVAQRQKMTRLATQAKNRLHAVVQKKQWLVGVVGIGATGKDEPAKRSGDASIFREARISIAGSDDRHCRGERRDRTSAAHCGIRRDHSCDSVCCDWRHPSL
jgi:hypothetical protein